MNSPTHSLIALAALSKRGDAKRNWAVFIGSLLPDAVIYLWFPYQLLIKGEESGRIWDVLYFEPPMQTMTALFNSIPIYAVIAGLGLWMQVKTQAKRAGTLIVVFAFAALIHMATDLPVHAHDAYRHFWPLSDFRFYSPFSYYEADKHAVWVSAVEAILALSAIILLWRRFPKLWVKIMLGFLACLYIALQIMMRVLPFGGGA